MFETSLSTDLGKTTHHVFRVDSGSALGIGHVMRCVTLADALGQAGARCTFVTREHPGNYIDHLENSAHAVVRLPALETSPKVGDHRSWLGSSATDASDTQAAMEAIGVVDQLIVDHYGIDESWERQFHSIGLPILVIDDLADRNHACDLLVDHNLGRQKRDYDGLVPEGAVVMVGPGYAILRPDFARHREQSLAAKSSGIRRRLLISMGGVDADNFTRTALQAAAQLADSGQDIQADVVLSPVATHISAVEEAIAALPFKAVLGVGVSNMAELMAECDVCVGAAGVSMLERLTMGLPTVVLVNADNQISGASELDRAGLGIFAGWTNKVDADQLAMAIRTLLVDDDVYSGIMRRSAAVSDGNGCALVAAKCIELADSNNRLHG